MKKILLIAIFLVSWVSTAQINLTGIVKDSIGTPLEMANVIALDTVAKRIASYGFTDANGSFKLELAKNTTYNIKISYIGFKEISEFVRTSDKNITKTYTMVEDNMLDGINIVSKMPVRIKGDTIIYDADSFKNGSERKLKDVLEKLPGVEINDAGQIEVEGKPVEKIMVDGKEFFSGDTKLATENIPSNAVDKIEVLRNFSSVNQLSGVQDNQNRVAINIKLKEGKKNFWFGDVYAGAGASPNDGLYLFQPKLFYYTPKYTINIIGDINNIGEAVLDRGDLRSFTGGFRSQSPSNGTNINLASAGIGFLTANARNANRIETKLTALNFSYSPNPKLDLSGYLIWSGNSNGRRNRNIINYNDASIQDDVTDNTTDQTSNSGLFNFKSVYKKNIDNQINYDLNGRFTNEFRTDNGTSQVIGNNVPILENENATPFTINQNLSYFYTASATSIFALEVQHQIQDEDPFYVSSLENFDQDPNNNADGFDSAADVLGLDKTQQFYTLEQDRRVKSNQLDAKLDYYYIINKKSNFNFVGGTILSRQNFDSRFFQILDNQNTLNPSLNIPNVPNASTTNDVEYNFTDLYGGMRYRVKSGIFTFRPGFTLHSYNLNNTQAGITPDFSDSFTRFLPELNIIAQFKQSESLELNYREQVNFTDVNQVAQGIVANSFSSFFFGNNDIMNARVQTASLNYRSFNLFNNTFVFGGLTYNKTMEQISTIADFVPDANNPNLRSIVSTNTNLNLPFDIESISAFGRVTKTFGKIRTSLGANYTDAEFFQLFGQTTTQINTKNYSLTPSIRTNFRKAPNVSLNYRASFSDQDRTELNSGIISTFETVTHAPSLNFDAYIWNSLTVKTDFTYNEVRQNGQHQNSFKIWDFSMSYRKDRDAKWEYELEASNILGTESNIRVNNGNISNSINETFILPRLITFRLRYQL
ncbi:carboxypeptidase-like regulatory domain-containing protein [Polaribacter sp. Hel_I_88]|uniref:carboxypeptidase-like regulatory domain-containing protein n=1 Tax=Polaribacter sp. Hel_I_88 TaxID=1250006 RepID=UPI00047D468D|nr:carboxypeptidase-like regulatory domain-containing protein [Polaribacter sp. Hel_I_88]